MPEENKGNDQSVEPVVSGQSSGVSKSGEGEIKAAEKQQSAVNNQQSAEEAASSQQPAASKPADTAAADAAKPAASAAPKAAPPAAPAAPKPAAAATPAAPGAAKPAAPAAAKPAAPPKPEGPKPVPWDSPIAQRLKASYGSGVKEASTYIGQNYLVVDKAIIHDALTILCHDEQFDYCVDVTAVHYPKKDDQFEVVYVLYSFPQNQRLRVKTSIKEGERIPTVSDIWPTANWLEREVFDMFGIEFEGHPDPRRILLPEDWKGHPLRKDHDILQQDNEWVHIHLGIESGQ
jgi:NADH-quinone oxidoreductase subunit C